MRSLPPARIAILLAASLLAGCAADSARERAVGRAADALLVDLRAQGLAGREPSGSSSASGSAGGTAGQAEASSTVSDVIVEAPDDLSHDIAVALQGPVNIVSRGASQDRIVEHLVDQLREVYENEEQIPDQARAGLQRLEGLGGQRKADLLVITDARDYPDRRVKITLLAYRLADGSLVATGVGSSHGVLQATGTVLIWAASPFVALYDVGRHSARYAFSGSEKPTILGTLGNTLLAIIYLPVAFFTCDYELTQEWVSD